MLNIWAKFHENRTCSSRDVTTSAKNERTNQPTNPREGDTPQIWNDLPADLTSAELLSTFHRRLKIHLFTKPFRGYFRYVMNNHSRH